CRNDDGLGDGGLQGPESGSFLPGLVEDHINERFAGFGILLAENLRSDVDQIAIELALVPFAVSIGQLIVIHSDDVFKNGIGLADQLHVAVLNAVVDHFDVMACAIGSHVSATRFAIDLRRDLAKDRRNNFPRFTRTPGHERWTFECALFAAGNAATDIVNSASLKIFAAALGVGKKRIAAV